MAVFNGQPVDADTTNAAFMSRTQDTDTVGKVSLLNTGSDLIDDTQAYINKIAQSDGITSETDTTNLNYSSNEIVADGDNRKVAIGKLDASLGLTNLTVDDHETRLDTAELEINILQSDLTAHTSNTSNPHATTAAQVGADPAGTASSAVAAHVAAADPHSQYLTSTEGDAAYLKRTANDFTTFTEKTTPIAADVMLIEDSEASFAKKKITLTNLLGGGSGGDINFISNSAGSTGTTGWVTGSYAAAARPSGAFTASSGSGAFAISTTTTSPLGVGTTSFLLTKSSGASRQGRAIQYEFDLPLDYRAKVLSLDIHYIVNSGTFVAGSTGVDSSLIWYTSFSSDGTNFTVSEPSSFKCLSNSTTISDQFKAEVQSPSDAIKMRLIAYVAESATTAWEVKTIFAVSPSKYVFGTPITDLVNQWTPIVTYASGSATNLTWTGLWGKRGDHLIGQIKGSFSAASAAFAAPRIGMPPGLRMDTSKLLAGANGFKINGFAEFEDAATANYIGTVEYFSATQLQLDSIATGGTYATNGGLSNTVPFTFGSGDTIVMDFEVPILGWSSSVQMSDSFNTRVISAKIVGATATLSATLSKITFSTVSFDDIAGYSSGTYTVRTAGKYKVSPTIIISRSATAAGNIISLATFKNGVVQNISVLRDLSTEAQSRSIALNDILDCKAGDTIEIYASAEGTSPTIPLDAQRNFLVIERLTGPSAIASTETVGMLYTGAPPTGTLGAAFNLVTYGTKVKDSHNSYASGIWTSPASGQYDIEAQIGISGTRVLNTLDFCLIQLTRNGSSSFISTMVSFAGGNQSTAWNKASIKAYPLLVGDQLSVYSYTTATSPSFDADSSRNFFCLSRSGNY